MTKRILFLCTGNYYRSRFAEELFNTLARQARIGFIADSRALAIELGIDNPGPISIHARQELERHGIILSDPVRNPLPCREPDLQSAWRIIAMKEAEHRRYLTQRYPGWADVVEYWHIHDLDRASPDIALTQITRNVTSLIERLRFES